VRDKDANDAGETDPVDQSREDIVDDEVVMRDIGLAVVERVDLPPLRAAWDGDGVTIEQVLPALPTESVDFDAFYLRHRSVLLRKMLSLCARDKELAEDITQTTMLVAYRVRHRLTEVDDHEAWLYTVASRAAWKVFQRQRAEEELLRTMAARPASSGQPHDWALLDDLLGRFLSTRQRQIIIHRFVDGQQIKWIADQVGVSQRTINIEIRKSLEKLRPFLDPRQEDN
jgi:RNA polymerase sigma-70 factor (ECF subfamily)